MNYTVREDGDLRKYRTETPNIVFCLGLNPFELALYCHLKRTAGANGASTKSTETLAEETGMGKGSVSRAKAGLAMPRKELNFKPLIVIDKDESRSGRPRDVITITDIWPENFAHFSKQSSPVEQQSSPQELQSSPVEPKKEPIQESNERASDPTEDELTKLLPVDAYERAFSTACWIHLSTQILARKLDPRAWARTLIEWRTNGYSTRNIAGMFQRHDKVVEIVKAEKARAPAGKPITVPAETPEQKQARLARDYNRQQLSA